MTPTTTPTPTPSLVKTRLYDFSRLRFLRFPRRRYMYIKHSRTCLTTFPNSSKFAKNTPLRVIFELFSLFENRMKHCLSCLIYYLQQFRSSLTSPQSLSPSHFHSVRTQRWLSQVNSVGRQVGWVQFACSSEPSPQSSSRSQTNRFGMHRVLLQENLSAPQPSGGVVAAKRNSNSQF